MSGSLLLDTHALVWWVDGGERLSAAQRRAIRQIDENRPLLVSDISLWEIAVLVELGRLELALPTRDWLEKATAPPLVQRVGILPSIAAEAARLPESFHRDPADRIIVATARILGAKLVTSDRRIIRAKAVPTVH